MWKRGGGGHPHLWWRGGEGAVGLMCDAAGAVRLTAQTCGGWWRMGGGARGGLVSGEEVREAVGQQPVGANRVLVGLTAWGSRVVERRAAGV